MNYTEQVAANIASMVVNTELRAKGLEWVTLSAAHNYSYNFTWMGRPIIQYPQDIVAMQELIWAIKPDLIIETGIAHGGSLIFSASMLALLDMAEAIEAHPMASRIKMIQGSSIAPDIVAQVKEVAQGYQRIFVCLDSNHTHDHVLSELEAYAPLASVGSYCVVFDTVVDNMPAESFPNRPWGPGNNPKTAVHEYLKSHGEFQIDHGIDAKLLMTVAPDGYLKRVR